MGDEKLTNEQYRALAQLEGNDKLLSSALDKIKHDLWDEYWNTEEHEVKSREELYRIGSVIKRFRALITKSVNQSNKGDE